METLRCFRDSHHMEQFKDDGLQTVTSGEQKRVERCVKDVLKVYQQIHSSPHSSCFLVDSTFELSMNRGVYAGFAEAFGVCLRLKARLGMFVPAVTMQIKGFSVERCLDASRPWLCYWILHSLELLEEPVPASIASDVCQFLSRCQSPTGGFAGGPGQHAHLAPTYAAVNALCILGTEEAYSVINREKLLDFLFSVKQPNGSFVMHVGGEVDVRSAYCAASVASLTNIMTPKLFEGTQNWIISCQTWEGGLGGIPGLEAHGGYTFCGMAALVILGKEHMLDLRALLRWVTSRQMRFEGGFQGRCNKLVDGCYSFWQAGLLPLLHRALYKDAPPPRDASPEVSRDEGGDGGNGEGGGWSDSSFVVTLKLQKQAQVPPGSQDFYHTCYCLSGLSVAQHFGNKDLHHELIIGKDENRLAPTHPVYNICPEKVAQAIQYFHKFPAPARRDAFPSAHHHP
ncbi:Protein farnesyltransferase subunit beta [Bagarius yarrelli]|uniref:Protein farnesyltransferase subunit beta n=1 Tax=Bagarius yarrelli TaxID=175774 RepID=A0A556V224_BAGYA|nr:Protein farnesyltransferase subunit beta [Bagarius yarrelli]